MSNNIPSQMRHRITIQSQALVSDNAGGQIIVWSDLKTIWAKVDNQTNSISKAVSSEKEFAEQLQNKNHYKITTRYQSYLSPLMQIIYDNKILNIKSINNVNEKNEFIQIYAIEEVSL